MVVELALAHALPKPWGVVDLFPWSKAGYNSETIGEIWYERADNSGVDASLLLKLLFTSKTPTCHTHTSLKRIFCTVGHSAALCRSIATTEIWAHVSDESITGNA
jgi:hypothetical protein